MVQTDNEKLQTQGWLPVLSMSRTPTSRTLVNKAMICVIVRIKIAPVLTKKVKNFNRFQNLNLKTRVVLTQPEFSPRFQTLTKLTKQFHYNNGRYLSFKLPLLATW